MYCSGHFLPGIVIVAFVKNTLDRACRDKRDQLKMLLLCSYKEMVKNTQGLLLGLTTLTQRNDGKIFSSKLAGQGDFLSECPALLRESMVGRGRWMVAHLRKSRETDANIQPLICHHNQNIKHTVQIWLEQQCI